MSEEKVREPAAGVEVEEHPECPFDLLRLTLPLPRLLFLPKETRQHLQAARREHLLAWRSILDAAIQRLEEGEKPKRKAESIKVE